MLCESVHHSPLIFREAKKNFFVDFLRNIDLQTHTPKFLTTILKGSDLKRFRETAQNKN